MEDEIQDPPRKWSYYVVKSIFVTAFTAFYNHIEVTGRDKFPRQGPVILGLNHVSSVVDGAMLLLAFPRAVRGTMKDKLLQDPLFGLMLRAGEGIGIKRRMDYGGDKCDNSQAFEQLFLELNKGCCVGMFPEGIGRYKPDLSPFKVGVASTAIDFVIHQCSKEDSKFEYANILPVGLTYLHRDMYRSNVSIRIGNPILINKDFIVNRTKMLRKNNKKEEKENNDKNNDENNDKTNDILDLKDITNDEKYQIAKYVTNILSDRVYNVVISVPEWHTIVLSHLARQIMFPKLSSIRNGINSSMANYIDVTRQFATILANKNNSDNNSDNNNDSNNSNSSNDAGTNNKITDSKDKQLVNECFEKLDKYFWLLRQHRLKDSRVCQLIEMKQNETSSIMKKLSIFVRMLLRLFIGIILFIICIPGLILQLPIIISWKLIRRHIIKQGVFNRLDGMAQIKMFVAYFGTPALYVIYSLVVYYLFDKNRLIQFIILFPFLIWTLLRIFEESVANIRSFVALFRILKLSNVNELKLMEMHIQCQQCLKQLVDKYDIKNDLNIVNPKYDKFIDTSTWCKWLCRCILGRNKKDWNETMRLRDFAADEFYLETYNKETKQS